MPAMIAVGLSAGWAAAESGSEVTDRPVTPCTRAHRHDSGNQEHHDAVQRDVPDVRPGEDIAALVHWDERPQGT